MTVKGRSTCEPCTVYPQQFQSIISQYTNLRWSAAFYPTEKGAEGGRNGISRNNRKKTHTHMVKNPISRQKLFERPTVILVAKGVFRYVPCTRRMSTFRGTKAFFLLGRQRSPGPACNAVCHATAVTCGTWH